MNNLPARRNVLLITADQWRGDCLSARHHPVVRTPTLDALAAAGTLFTRHYANAVPCGPSRACLHTGMYLHNHRSGTNGTPLDARFTNWALEARRAGYDPALFGYTHSAADPRGLALDDARLTTDEGLLPGITAVVDMASHCGPWRDWLQSLGYPLPAEHGATYGVRHADPTHPMTPRPSRYAAQHTDTYFLTQSAIDWISAAQQRAGPGWIAHLSLRAPHPPWVAAAPYHARYPIDTLPAPVRHATLAEEAALHPWLDHYLQRGRSQAHADTQRHRLLQASYYGLMAEVDDNLGRLFAHLDAINATDETLILFTSDHGEQMGDHWQYGKAGFFEQSYHIPLIARMPGGSSGQQVSAFTEHVDLMPSMLDWLRLATPAQCDGASLLPHIRGMSPPHWRTAAHWEFDFRAQETEAALGLRMEACTLNVLRREHSKYVHFAALPPLLFDLTRDPGELHNVAERPDYAALRNAHAHELLSWRMQHTDKTLSHMQVTPATGMIIRQRAAPSETHPAT